MAAAQVPLNIEKGATFVAPFQYLRRMDGGSVTIDGKQWEPQDLTGADVRAEVRQRAGAPLLHAFATVVTDAAAGKFELRMTAAETDAIEWRGGQYDLEVELPDGTVERLAQGAVTVSPSITTGTP